MRPFIIGEVTPERVELTHQLIAIQDCQLAAMKPGVCAKAIDAIARDAILTKALRTEYQ